MATLRLLPFKNDREYLKLTPVGNSMQQDLSKYLVAKVKTSAVCLLFLITSLSAGIGGVQASSANQNDLSTGGDLPNQLTPQQMFQI